MSDCDHNCEGCSQNCSERSGGIVKESMGAHSSVKKVFAVVSGKGGVGKSLVTSLLAVASAKKGLATGVFDGDITGPSIPTAFGVKDKILATDEGMIPALSAGGVRIMSLNLLIPNETDPVVWRGPVLGGVIKQFWTDVVWGDLDIMFIDMPPGTADVPLTVFQSLPIDGIIMVTTPQDLVSMIVAKAVNMARLMKIPVVGLVENMSYFKCPDCGAEHDIFGRSRAAETAAAFGIEHFVRLPLEPLNARMVDEGRVEQIEAPGLDAFLDEILK